MPILLLPFFISKANALTWFFVLFALSSILLTASGNAWTGWMADLVPSAIRARYFSRRAFIITLVTIIIIFLGGIFLDACKSSNTITNSFNWFFPSTGYLSGSEYALLVGFGIIFLVALLTGLVGIILLSFQSDPPPSAGTKFHQPQSTNIVKLISHALRDKPFRNLLVFMVVWNIINGFSVPFWTPYLLQDLQMSYGAVGIYSLIGGITRLLTLLFWGKIIDRFGAKPVLLATIYIGSFHPLLYVVSSPDFTALIYLDSLSSGIMWSGVEIAILKMLLGSAPERGKEMYYAIYGTITGIAVSIPQFIAGALVDRFPEITVCSFHITSVQFIFWAVAIGRFACLGLVVKLSEPSAKPLIFMLRALRTQLKEIFILR